MNPRDEQESPVEDVFDALVLAYDEALATDATSLAADETIVPDELVPRMRSTKLCLTLLDRAGRDRRESDSSSAGTPGYLPLGAGGNFPQAIHRIGRFEVIRELGRGGYGVVFLALDTGLQRQVALKVPRPEVIVTPELSRRFLREAQAAGSLEHPNLVTVYEVGQDGPFCYIASAYCTGPTLAQWLLNRSEPVAVRQAAELVAALADGVENAHNRGVLHRDIKPSNVLLEPRTDDVSSVAPPPVEDRFTPKLTDFGLARLQNGDGEATRSGTMLGTASYMAPEQATGRLSEIGNPTDVYGLGTILYELLTGQRAFQGASDVDTVRRVVQDEPLSPRRHRCDLPRDLEAICLKCLEKRPDRRYPSAALLAGDLRRFLAGEPTLARPMTRGQRLAKWARRRPALASLVAVSVTAAVLLVVLGSAYILHLRESRDTSAFLRAEADRSAATVRQQERIANRNLYASRMRLAYLSIDQGELEDVEQLLDDYADGGPLADLRGFEWYHLKQRLHGESLTLPAHRDEVYGVAFSPSGRVLASGGQDGLIKLWDPESGQELATITGHAGCVNELAYSPDGRILASSSCDHTIKLWDATTHELIDTLEGHPDIVTCLAFSADGRRLATGGNDPLARVWDVASSEIVSTFDTRRRTIDSIRWQSDVELIIAAAGQSLDAGRVFVWNLQDDTSRTITAQADAIATDPSSAEFALGGKNSRIVLDGTSPTAEPLMGHIDRVLAVAYSPDGRWLASGSSDRTIRLWDRKRGGYQQVFNGHIDRVRCLAFASHARLLASGSLDGTVKLWRVSVALPRQLPDFAPMNSTDLRGSIAISPDFRYLALLVAADRIGVLDLHDGQQLYEREVPQGVTRQIHFLHADSPILFGVPRGAGYATKWNVVADTLDGHFPRPGGQGDDLAMSGDGHHLVARNYRGLTVTDLRSGQEWFTTGTIEPAAYLWCRYSPDRQTLAIGVPNEDSAWIVSFAAGQSYRMRRGSPLAISNGTELVAARDNPGSMVLIEPQSGRERFTLRHSTPLHSATAFSPDGKTLATSTVDGSIHLWNIASGQQLAEFKTAAAQIIKLQFSVDSRQLAAIGVEEQDSPDGVTSTALLFVWSGLDER